MNWLFQIIGFLMLAGCSHSSTYPISDHYDGKKFFNPEGPNDKSFTDLLKWQWNRKPTPWPDWVENKKSPEFQTPNISSEAVVTFINHSTFVIQLQKLNIITDPHFGDRASPVSFAGPKRVRAPGAPIDQLPKIDVVMVSHNHYDHLDIASLEKLKTLYDPIFLVPLGNAKYLSSTNSTKVIELDWWQSHRIADYTFTLTPAQHWSARGLMDRREALWGSFSVEWAVPNKKPYRIYFSGDTGWGNHFKATAEKLGDFQLSFLPIGAYEPRWFMKAQHINPTEAVDAHLSLQSKVSIGMHFGTFQLTDEGIDEPVLDLKKALIEKNISNDQFQVLEFGETKKWNLEK